MEVQLVTAEPSLDVAPAKASGQELTLEELREATLNARIIVEDLVSVVGNWDKKDRSHRLLEVIRQAQFQVGRCEMKILTFNRPRPRGLLDRVDGHDTEAELAKSRQELVAQLGEALFLVNKLSAIVHHFQYQPSTTDVDAKIGFSAVGPAPV